MKTMGFVKGIGVGMIAGVAATMVGKQMLMNNRTLAKKTTKAVKAASNIMDDIHNLLS